MFSWLLAFALAWHAGAPVQAPENSTPEQITTLPPALRQHFAQQVLAGRASRRQRLERLVNFVFDAQGLGMRYDEAATPTVEQAYATRRANCLGFTLLFIALAREAGIEAHPRVIEETLSWHRTEGIFFRNSHVNAEVHIGSRRFTLDVARNAVIVKGEPVRLTQPQLLARYHNNVAMELLAQGDLALARRHMARALELEPGQASHWSNAGVLELRRGDASAARSAYARALELDPRNSNALFNLVTMARREGDGAREAEFRERLRRVQQQDPFHHFLQAIDHERSGDFVQAVAHYRRAIELHRGGDHRFHAALAGALLRTGDAAAARDALQRAIASSRGDARAAYRARLEGLREAH